MCSLQFICIVSEPLARPNDIIEWLQWISCCKPCKLNGPDTKRAVFTTLLRKQAIPSWGCVPVGSFKAWLGRMHLLCLSYSHVFLWFRRRILHSKGRGAALMIFIIPSCLVRPLKQTCLFPCRVTVIEVTYIKKNHQNSVKSESAQINLAIYSAKLQSLNVL